MTDGYPLGSLAPDGAVRAPWYIRPGRQTELFGRFLAHRETPPEDEDAAADLLRTTFELCADSPAFFGHEFADIPLGAGGVAPFNQWTPGQRMFHDAVESQRGGGRPVRVICLKARREGVSTLCQLYGAWLTAFHEHRNGMIAAHEDDASATLFSMCRRFIDAVPEPMRCGRREDSKAAVELAAPLHGRVVHRTVAPGGGSKANAGKGRGMALHWLHASEASRWDEPETFWNGVVQCVEDYPETYVLIESTANSYGWFQEMWAEAAAGWELRWTRHGGLQWVCTDPRASRSDLVPVFLSWLAEPKYSLPFDDEGELRRLTSDLDPDERALVEGLGATPEQIHWRRRTLWGSKFKGDLAAFREEYPATPSEAFRSSGRKVFDSAALDRAERRISAEVRRPARHTLAHDADGTERIAEHPEGEIAVWREPAAGRMYAMGVDGSYGKPDGDWMVCEILDCSTQEQVAEIRVRESDADDFAASCDLLGRRYNDAVAVVEVNGPGLPVLKEMDRRMYPAFYFRTQPDDSTGEPKKTFGWWTSDKSRRWLVSELRDAVRTGELVVNSMGAVEEMRGWVLKRSASGKTKEQPSSPKGHDDRITALGLALVGGCIEAGAGEAIGSKKVGDERPGQARPEVRAGYDTKVRSLLFGAGSGRRTYDPVLGAV